MSIVASDHTVPTARGNLFARLWTPVTSRRGTPTILLLHDSLGCVELWRDFPERLSEETGLPVLAYDRLGFGRSAAHPGTLDARFITEEARQGLRAVRDALEIGRMILAGHSVGGGMAIAGAAELQMETVAVITMSAQTFLEDRTVMGIREAQDAFTRPGQIDRLARYHGNKARWVLEAWIETWLAPGFANWSLDEELAKLRCPVLAIHGDSDEYGSAAHPKRIAALSAGQTTTVMMESTGHIPWREHPEVVLTTIRTFIAGL